MGKGTGQDEAHRVIMRLVAEKIPEDALGWLWTVHQIYNEQCPAHMHGEVCCLDLLLENAPHAPIAVKLPDGIAEIIKLGYDLIIESDTDDRTGPVNIFLTYPEQPSLERRLTFQATPGTLPLAIEKARTYAAAFPKEITQ